jgi:hypothetical protein
MLTTPALEPVAYSASLAETAKEVEQKQPSSSSRNMHLRIRMSHVCTTPSLPTRPHTRLFCHSSSLMQPRRMRTVCIMPGTRNIPAGCTSVQVLLSAASSGSLSILEGCAKPAPDPVRSSRNPVLPGGQGPHRHVSSYHIRSQHKISHKHIRSPGKVHNTKDQMTLQVQRRRNGQGGA